MFNDCYYGKKVLVTGHTGFKGSWLTAWLQKLGAKVAGISLQPNTTPNHFELLKPNCDSHLLDIRDAKQLKKIVAKINPEIIFHLAAQPLVRESYKEPLYTLETNVIGSANLLIASQGLLKLKAIVMITTDKCYENKEWIWGYRENDRLGGYDPYSMSKSCAELVIASFRNSFFNIAEYGKTHQTLIASARAGNVIGGGDWSQDRLIPDIVTSAAKNKAVEIRKPNATRPWQHVLECLNGYLCLGEKLLAGKKQFAEAWNFAPSAEGTETVLKVVEKMQQAWPKIKFKINEHLANLHEADLLKLDCSKSNNVLNWQHIWDLDCAIKTTISWYRSFYEDNKIITESDIDAFTLTFTNKKHPFL